MKPRARQARSAGFDPQVSHPAAVAKMANALGLSPRNCRLESGPQHSSAQVAKRETRCVQTAVTEMSWRFDSSSEHHADVVERNTPSAENAGPKGMRVRLPPSARRSSGATGRHAELKPPRPIAGVRVRIARRAL